VSTPLARLALEQIAQTRAEARAERLAALPPRTKDHPDVRAAWQHMVACARAFVRSAEEFGNDIGATAEHYDALERAQERLARTWEGEPVEPAWQMPREKL